MSISIFLSKNASGSWFSPGPFFGALWFFFTLVPLLMAPEFLIDFSGIWYISLIVMSCASGSIMASLLVNKNAFLRQKVSNLNFNELIPYLIIFSAISTIGIIFLISFSINVYKFNFNESWWNVPNLISIDRYSGELQYPAFIKYTLYFIYPGNIIAGIVLNKKIKTLKLKLLIYLPILLSLFLGIIEGSRTSLLLGLILFISSWMSTRVKIGNGNLNISFIKFIVSFVLLITSFIFLFVLIQWLRQGLDPIIIDLIFLRIKSYFFGYLSAFTIWCGQIESVFSINTLFTTFAGPFNLVGIIDRDLGFYSPIYINNNISTNIFTALRGIISDFSYFGSILIFFIIGFLFQLEFQKRRISFFDGIIPLSIFYSFALYSPLISIFHYNSIFFSWFIVFFIIKISK